MIEPCPRNGLVGGQLGDFCPACHHCVGMHDDKGLCAACTTKEVLIARVQPGDVVILRSQKPIDDLMGKLLWDWAHELWPNNQIGVMFGEVEIEIMRPGKE